MRKEMLNYVKKYSRKRDRNLKYDFMPELLEIIEKPAHIGGKVIKLEAYPYSEYGTLTGKITYISAGAVSTDEVKNVYVVKLSIENNNDKIKLLPGMTATVEFDLGKRSIMKYFLDPIAGALKNTAREK